jgi:hypothetical protein
MRMSSDLRKSRMRNASRSWMREKWVTGKLFTPHRAPIPSTRSRLFKIFAQSVSTTTLILLLSDYHKMSHHSTNAVEEQEVESLEPKENIWRSTWNNNKGACLILLAELAGATMDAIARYLQQGTTKFHPFQVCDLAPGGYSMLINIRPADNLRAHGYNLRVKQRVYVVDKGTKFSFGRSKCPGLVASARCIWVWRTLLLVL